MGLANMLLMVAAVRLHHLGKNRVFLQRLALFGVSAQLLDLVPIIFNDAFLLLHIQTYVQLLLDSPLILRCVTPDCICLLFHERGID